jgi:hypothetical protein
MTTQADFAATQSLQLSKHGDARERCLWPAVADRLSEYERIWKSVIALFTNRVVVGWTADEWIRVRPNLPTEYADLVMSNYSVFYYAARAFERIRIDKAATLEGQHCQPELFFFLMQTCVEKLDRLKRSSRNLLAASAIRPKFPKDTTRLLNEVMIYRDAFAHDP